MRCFQDIIDAETDTYHAEGSAMLKWVPYVAKVALYVFVTVIIWRLLGG